MTRDQIIETMARALREYEASNPPMWRGFDAEATAALSALEAAGLAVVPVEPTEANAVARSLELMRLAAELISKSEGAREAIIVYDEAPCDGACLADDLLSAAEALAAAKGAHKL